MAALTCKARCRLALVAVLSMQACSSWVTAAEATAQKAAAGQSSNSSSMQAVSDQSANGAGRLTPAAHRPMIVCVGDGLTQSAFTTSGWGYLMTSAYNTKADVLNRGFGGFYTTWIADYMLNDLWDVPRIKLAILFLGAKDSLQQAATGPKHYISPEAFSSNMDKIMAKGKASGVENFLIITPPPVCESCRSGNPAGWDRRNSHTALYVQVLQNLGTKYNAPVLDIFTAWQKEPNWNTKYLAKDNLHLSDTGNQAILDAIIKTLAEKLPSAYAPNLPRHWPDMNDINHDNPGAAFNPILAGSSSSRKG